MRFVVVLLVVVAVASLIEASSEEKDKKGSGEIKEHSKENKNNNGSGENNKNSKGKKNKNGSGESKENSKEKKNKSGENKKGNKKVKLWKDGSGGKPGTFGTIRPLPAIISDKDVRPPIQPIPIEIPDVSEESVAEIKDDEDAEGVKTVIPEGPAAVVPENPAAVVPENPAAVIPENPAAVAPAETPEEPIADVKNDVPAVEEEHTEVEVPENPLDDADSLEAAKELAGDDDSNESDESDESDEDLPPIPVVDEHEGEAKPGLSASDSSSSEEGDNSSSGSQEVVAGLSGKPVIPNLQDPLEPAVVADPPAGIPQQPQVDPVPEIPSKPVSDIPSSPQVDPVSNIPSSPQVDPVFKIQVPEIVLGPEGRPMWGESIITPIDNSGIRNNPAVSPFKPFITDAIKKYFKKRKNQVASFGITNEDTKKEIEKVIKEIEKFKKPVAPEDKPVIANFPSFFSAALTRPIGIPPQIVEDGKRIQVPTEDHNEIIVIHGDDPRIPPFHHLFDRPLTRPIGVPPQYVGGPSTDDIVHHPPSEQHIVLIPGNNVGPPPPEHVAIAGEPIVVPVHPEGPRSIPLPWFDGPLTRPADPRRFRLTDDIIVHPPAPIDGGEHEINLEDLFAECPDDIFSYLPHYDEEDISGVLGFFQNMFHHIFPVNNNGERPTNVYNNFINAESVVINNGQ